MARGTRSRPFCSDLRRQRFFLHRDRPLQLGDQRTNLFQPAAAHAVEAQPHSIGPPHEQIGRDPQRQSLRTHPHLDRGTALEPATGLHETTGRAQIGQASRVPQPASGHHNFRLANAAESLRLSPFLSLCFVRHTHQSAGRPGNLAPPALLIGRSSKTMNRTGLHPARYNRVFAPMNRSPILLIHGGAWDIPADMLEAHEQGVFDALQAGWRILEGGGSAVDAVEASVSSMEDDPAFDAGRGSFLTRDGRVQLDALIMDGAAMRAGGVACVERIRNPIQAARLVLDKSHHVYFVGPGAEEFAASHGMKLIDNSELVLDRERERLAEAQKRERSGVPDPTFSGSPSQEASGQESHDTVGAVALDSRGRLAAATSTGGTLNKAPGRVGDSSLIGCGCYADNASAAVSLTGWGEPIMKLVLGKWATDRVQDGRSPEQVAADAIHYLFRRLGGHGGIILLAPDGRYGLAHNTPRMAWGIHTAEGPRVGTLIRDEDNGS